MAIKSTQQQLEEVQAAIEQVLASQEMGAGSDRVRRPELSVLYAREDVLLKRLAAENKTGGFPAFNTGVIRNE